MLDEQEMRTTQRGGSCVYLFRQDMSGVYLTFNQGVTELINEHGKSKAHEILREKAADLRKSYDDLGQHGFRLDGGIDLRADWGLGVDYESSTIAYKLHEAGQMPDDEVVLGDLEAPLVEDQGASGPVGLPVRDTDLLQCTRLAPQVSEFSGYL